MLYEVILKKSKIFKKMKEYKKIKFSKNGGLLVEFIEIEGETIKNKKVKVNQPCHPDLLEVAKKLRNHLIVCHNPSENALLKSFKKLSKAALAEMTKKLSQVQAVSLTIVGEEDDRGFIIGGKKEVFSGRYVGFNTPTIMEEDPEYKFCGNLADLVDELINEVEEYMFNNKYAQLELFGEEAEIEVEEPEPQAAGVD